MKAKTILADFFGCFFVLPVSLLSFLHVLWLLCPYDSAVQNQALSLLGLPLPLGLITELRHRQEEVVALPNGAVAKRCD